MRSGHVELHSVTEEEDDSRGPSGKSFSNGVNDVLLTLHE